MRESRRIDDRASERLGPDVEDEGVDLDTADTQQRGGRPIEARAKAAAADLLACAQDGQHGID